MIFSPLRAYTLINGGRFRDILRGFRNKYRETRLW